MCFHSNFDMKKPLEHTQCWSSQVRDPCWWARYTQALFSGEFLRQEKSGNSPWQLAQEHESAWKCPSSECPIKERLNTHVSVCVFTHTCTSSIYCVIGCGYFVFTAGQWPLNVELTATQQDRSKLHSGVLSRHICLCQQKSKILFSCSDPYSMYKNCLSHSRWG